MRERELLGLGGGGAQAQAKGYAMPFVNVTYTMPLPAGVVVRSASASPKTITTSASIANNAITWDLGSVKPGAKVAVALKLVAPNCTTPAPLALNGKFSYIDAVGPKTVDACLKKDLYVWKKGCPAIPKAGHAPKQSNKNTTGKVGHKSYNKCCCNMCEVRRRGSAERGRSPSVRFIATMSLHSLNLPIRSPTHLSGPIHSHSPTVHRQELHMPERRLQLHGHRRLV